MGYGPGQWSGPALLRGPGRWALGSGPACGAHGGTSLSSRSLLDRGRKGRRGPMAARRGPTKRGGADVRRGRRRMATGTGSRWRLPDPGVARLWAACGRRGRGARAPASFYQGGGEEASTAAAFMAAGRAEEPTNRWRRRSAGWRLRRGIGVGHGARAPRAHNCGTDGPGGPGRARDGPWRAWRRGGERERVRWRRLSG